MLRNSLNALLDILRSRTCVFRHSLPNSIKFQSVGLEDYNDVISIRNGVYGDIDYLPALYSAMMANHYAYTATLNGRHVAFLCVMFVDDGETMIGKALRVSEDHKGRGLGHQMQRYVEQQHKLDRCIRRTAYTAFSERTLGRVEAGTAEVISTRNITYVRGTQSVIQKMALANTQIKVLQREEIREIFSSKEEKAKLFYDQRLMVDCVPYRLLESNVDIFHDNNCHVLSSRTCDQSESSGLLTVGYAYPTPGGYFCSVDIYGELTEDIFKKHMKQHAVECAGKGTDTVCFGCVYNVDYHDEKIISTIMLKFGLVKNGVNTLYLAEESQRL